jgi:hypothetical protein
MFDEEKSALPGGGDAGGDELSEQEKKRYFRDSVGLLKRTTPFLMLNAGIYTAFFVATIVWLAVWGGLAALFAERLTLLSVVFFIIAIGVPGGVIAWARKWLLYMVQGAHIAVLSKFVHDEPVPAEMGQVEFGRELVKQNFRDMNVLFLLDRLIDGTLKAFSRRFVRIVNWLPLGNQATSVARLITQILQRSLSYVDEAILSYAIVQRSQNVWASSRHGIILYAQSYVPILKTAVKVWAAEKVAFIAVLVALAAPAYLLVSFVDVFAFQFAVAVGTLLAAWLITRSVFEPWAMTYVLVTYHRTVEGMTPDPVWDQRLQEVSDKFRELVGKAREATGPGEQDPLDGAAASLHEGGQTAVEQPSAHPSQDQPAPQRSQQQAQPSFRDVMGGGRGRRGGGLGGALGGGLGGMLGKAAEGLMNQQGTQQGTQQAEQQAEQQVGQAPPADGGAPPASEEPPAEASGAGAPPEDVDRSDDPER